MNSRLSYLGTLAMLLCACSSALPPKKDFTITSAPAAATAPVVNGNSLTYYSIPDETASASDSLDQKAQPGDQQQSPASPSPKNQQDQQGQGSITSPQDIANALSADAKIEVTEWAIETLSIRFCQDGTTTQATFWQTCHTVNRYMQSEYESASVNDLQMLQDAVRADLSNYMLMSFIRSDATEAEKQDWVFLASLTERTQKYGLQKALSWIKDVPQVIDRCKATPGGDACKLRAKSVVISAFLDTQITDDPEKDCSTFVSKLDDDGVALAAAPDCRTVTTRIRDWLATATAGTDAAGAADLLTKAREFDRFYANSRSTGTKVSLGASAYGDRFLQAIAGLDGVGTFIADAGHNKNLKFMFMLYAAADANNYREIVYQLTEKDDDSIDLKDSIVAGSNTYNLLLLAGDIANANSTSDLANSINNISGPAAGYKYKTVAPHLLSATALVGLNYEWDHLSGPGVDTRARARGGFAPVGFEFSGPSPCIEKADLGVLLSLIDVGNLISYSNTNTTSNGSSVKSAPNTSFSQVWSPGLYLIWGFPNSPFVVGVGYSRTPELRTATLAATKTNLDASRFMIFVAVDITLSPLKEQW